jgi:hypothetical protein
MVDILKWTVVNHLKLNKDKTELLVLCTPLLEALWLKPQRLWRISVLSSISICKWMPMLHMYVKHPKTRFVTSARMSWLKYQLKPSSHLCSRSWTLGMHFYPTYPKNYWYNCKGYRMQQLDALWVFRSMTQSPKHLQVYTGFRIIDFKKLFLTWKALNGEAPDYLWNMLKPKTPVRHLRPASEALLEVPCTVLKTYGDSAFCVQAPKLFNNQLNSLKQQKTRDCFKRSLKTYLYHSVFERLTD